VAENQDKDKCGSFLISQVNGHTAVKSFSEKTGQKPDAGDQFSTRFVKERSSTLFITQRYTEKVQRGTEIFSVVLCEKSLWNSV